MISIRGLRKAFGARGVLAGVDMQLPKGAIAALVGPSGCGKSTLLRCLNALEDFDDGEVTVAGHTLPPHASRSPADLSRLRSKVGMVFQEFHLFPHMTALENITLAPRVVRGVDEPVAAKRAQDLLAKVGLADRAGAYPYQLSGGQKQRVAIARALAQPIEVLLLDEPTSALDPEMREEVRQVLRDVAHDHLTMVLVTHEMRLATELADSLWVLDGGRVVESGPPAEIIASPKSDVARDFLARVG